MLIGAINIFVPINKFVANIPVIGSSYVLLFFLAVFMLLFIINRLSVNISEREDSNCNIKGYDFIMNNNHIEQLHIDMGWKYSKNKWKKNPKSAPSRKSLESCFFRGCSSCCP
jgi:energy-coupling factor transporter transmembrane protein EcfT